MLKKRIGSIDRVDLEWSYLTRAEASKVLKAFKPEYVLVEYLDAELGDWRTELFCTGDRYAKGWTPHLDRWERVTLPITLTVPDKG